MNVALYQLNHQDESVFIIQEMYAIKVVNELSRKSDYQEMRSQQEIVPSIIFTYV